MAKKLSDKEWAKNLEFFKKYRLSEDPNFSEKRNREIIEGTIKKNDALRKAKTKAFKRKMGQRIDMVASYLKSRAVDGGTPIEKYLGKRWMAKLRAEQIINRLQNPLVIKNSKGEVINK